MIKMVQNLAPKGKKPQNARFHGDRATTPRRSDADMVVCGFCWSRIVRSDAERCGHCPRCGGPTAGFRTPKP